MITKKAHLGYFLARVEGIGPPFAVLETAVLPLNDTRIQLIQKAKFKMQNIGILLIINDIPTLCILQS